MVRDDFAILILSHKRAEKIDTLRLLEKLGYTGKWYIIIDNLDPELELYKKKYGDNVIVFDKEEEMKLRKTDLMINEVKENVVVWARNKVFEIAKNLGLNYFAEFDDDYTGLYYRIYNYERRKIDDYHVNNINELIEWTLTLLDETGVPVVAWAQTGDFIGGGQSPKHFEKIKRKVMNTFFWNLKKVNNLRFLGFLNEDVNFYIKYGLKGEIMFTIPFVCISQRPTQTNKGGLTDAYLEVGTYIKSFLACMIAPKSVGINLMGYSNPRLHHLINWDKTVPKIISDKYRKN